jgi:transposase
MQGKKEEQQKLFYTIGLDRMVPLDHPVRRIKDVLDLRFLYRETGEFCSTEGKPSVDPVVLFKLYLLGYLFGIPSERRLFREVQVNLWSYPVSVDRSGLVAGATPQCFSSHPIGHS